MPESHAIVCDSGIHDSFVWFAIQADPLSTPRERGDVGPVRRFCLSCAGKGGECLVGVEDPLDLAGVAGDRECEAGEDAGALRVLVVDGDPAVDPVAARADRRDVARTITVPASRAASSGATIRSATVPLPKPACTITS
jgi:hypothetical protein